MVYLFADHFVEQPRQFPCAWEPVPCTNRKVLSAEREDMIMAAAFIWLEEEGLVTLNVRRWRRKRFWGILGETKSEHVIVMRKEKISSLSPSSLESRILTKMRRKTRLYENSARTLTLKANGYITLVRNYLRREGYFWVKKRRKIFSELVPDCKKIAELKEYIEGTKNVISGFRKRNPEVYHQLFEDIRNAINARGAAMDGWDGPVGA